MTSEESPKGELRGVFPRDGMWGHKIVFDDYEERRVYGFLTPRAGDGDLFGYQMESGRIGVFELVDVDNKLDPSDMFFAGAQDVGYLDGLDGVEDDGGAQESVLR